MRRIDIKKFNALAAHTRSPAAAYVSQELDWFANDDETLLATLLLDTVDGDYVGVVLGRDEMGRFRCIDVESSLPTKEDAEAWIQRAMAWHGRDKQTTFPQGDGKNTRPLDLFTPIVPPGKLHPSFVRLCQSKAFAPARRLIAEIMPHYVDVDGNFVEQFQTTGFDARLWELYLHSYLVEEQLFIEREHDRPDFFVKKYGKSVAIEATIVGRRTDRPVSYFKTEISLPRDHEEVLRRREHEIPIRFGSPLFSKLQKRYWELDHVKGLPLVFAIADFHDDQSMMWTSTALIDYLYAVRHDFHFDENGQLVITPLKIEKHKVGNKEIPSGFFFQADAEHISAVLFSASGTISKFNRLGRQAGFKVPGHVMVRIGTHYDHNPNAHLPRPFKYIVDETQSETWAEGLSMFHNPNALHPVPEELFPTIAHHRFRDGQILSTLPEFHPYASLTMNLLGKE
ncbi:glycosaminoglycan attachment protein [Paraburkholderia phenazinium]|uniref:Glycosaminoglycan attachment protein n=1 Tax=Paraburkholderia phenazinium TaxID=60549 RepID=A0A1G7W7K5_9BURK|nr:glycosaminoglycan attachment protein [Paraburkholderia phenazinium]SDG68005.1 hypothetical protein SAMN05216466_104440 [Paraburkholderia phenazinium]